MLGINFTTYEPLRATLNGQPYPHQVPLEGPPLVEDEQVLRTQKKSFNETILGNVIGEVMKLREVAEDEFFIEIFKFFRTFLTLYFAKDPTDKVLIDLASAIFDPTSKFHVNVFVYRSKAAFCQFDVQESEDRLRVRRETDWRVNSLKVGDKVDVLRHKIVSKPNQNTQEMSIKGWTIGTVVFKGQFEEDNASSLVV
mmetsp:Transcript_21776/g.33641  ORF Transcript_21776/g.33641 Transcript_21776/m.33641 type:complete len:197 (-) Transcript_21776:9479-10069(-)